MDVMDKEIIPCENSDYTVFLVDDDAEDREFFSDALEEIGLKVALTLFSNGEDVLSKLRSSDKLPDILFLDLYMPKMDGEDCLAEIRAEEEWDEVCVVIYSTLMDMRRVEELFSAGANRYLRKPTSYPALKNALSLAIESFKNNSLGVQTVINYTE